MWDFQHILLGVDLQVVRGDMFHVEHISIGNQTHFAR
jgi:hypothetical protein